FLILPGGTCLFPLEGFVNQPREATEMLQRTVLLQSLSNELRGEMHRRGNRCMGIERGTTVQEFAQPTAIELTEYGIHSTCRVLPVDCRRISKRLVYYIQPVVTIAPANRQKRDCAICASRDYVDFGAFAPGRELMPRKFGMRVSLFLIVDC